MRLNLEQVRTFLTVVRSGGISRAASVLNVTQPAVTARIKNLEDTLGAQLFDRTGGSLRLTKRGEMLMHHAIGLEALSDRIERDIVEPDGIEGHLRIGASETIAQSWLPELIAALHARLPALEIEFIVDVSGVLRDGLLARETDLALLLGPISEPSVENVTLPDVPLGWYAAPGEVGDATTLFGKPIITYARNTRPYRDMRDRAAERLGPDVRLFPSASLSAALRLVSTGLGVAALPRSLASPMVTDGLLREFDPGWQVPPLVFTASYVADPPSHVVQMAARMAAEIARGT